LIDRLKINSIRFDAKSNLITIEGKTSGMGAFFRPRANRVTFELKSGKLINIYKSIDDTAHKIISDIADPIHFGDWGGLTTQIIWFILGLILSIAIIFGLFLSIKRISAKYHPSRYSFIFSILILLVVMGYSALGGFMEYNRNVDAAVILPRMYIFIIIFSFAAILAFSLFILLKSIHSTLYKNR
jgi:uncharacterized iron-regulated membrane protein